MYYAGDLRKAEMKGVGKVRQAMDRAREEWTDAERRLRQRMRVYPEKLRNLISRSNEEPALEFETHTAKVINMGDITPKPKAIVSVHGQDVDEKELK
jgi:E3 ubiquitin-protein ligase DOA10